LKVAAAAAATLVALGGGGCKKERPERGIPLTPAPGEHAPPGMPGGEGAANPHAGIDMSGGAGANPHAGIDMSGAAGANPHAGMDMGGMMGGGGGTVAVDKDGRAKLGPVTLAVPKGWTVEPNSSGMRAAQWKVGDAELVVFYFGQQGAGSAEANIGRWTEQFQDDKGQPGKAVTEKTKVGDMAVTYVEIAGRYASSMSPAGAAETHDNADWMMEGAVLETREGPYYFKLIGPRATVTAAKKDFRAFIASAK
jgi:hypothetical protein